MKFLLFLILITSCLVSSGQTISDSKKFADQLYETKSYQNALEVYNRVLFFDTTQIFAADIYPKIAFAYYQTEQYSQANAFYDLAYNLVENKETKNAYLFKKISGYLIQQQYEYAEIDYLSLDSAHILPSQIKEKIFFDGVINFSKGEYQKAKKSFLVLTQDSAAVERLFRKNDKVSKISPKKAKNLSRVVPGLGQLYVGDVKNGLNSMLLTGGLLALGVRASIVNNFVDASFAVGPWLQRYYKGGYTKAEAIAKAKILERRFKIYNQILDTLPLN